MAVLLLALLPGSVQAQDNLWMNGSQLLDFNNPVSGATTVCDLPIGPTSVDYQGVAAQYAQNAQYDENGKLLFFVVDGAIYDHAGYLIADNLSAPNCTDCLMRGIQEVSVILVPGTCDKYYIIGSDSRSQLGGANKSQIGYSILDLSGNSRYHAGRMGRVVHIDDDEPYLNTFLTEIGLTPGSTEADALLTLLSNQVSASYLPSDLGVDGAATFVLASGNIGVDAPNSSRRNNIYHVVCDSPLPSGEKSLFIRTVMEFLTSPITAHGIPSATHLADGGQGSYADEPLTMTGGMAVAQGPDGKLRLATTYNTSMNVVPGTGMYTLQISEVQLTAGLPTALTSAYVNTYPGTVPTPNTGRMRGVAFSPNGRYLYFSQAFAPRVGYVDVLDPALTVHDLETDLSLASGTLSPYSNGQIRMNRTPDGTGHAIYFPAVAGFGYLENPDDPANATWHGTMSTTQPLGTPPVSAALHEDYPALTHYLMDMQTYRDQQVASLEQAVCCELNQTIPEGSHPYFFGGITSSANPWTPQDNGLTSPVQCPPPGGSAAFGHVYFDQDFVVQTGARLFVQGMEWRFAPTARLIVEKGAFVKFDNCVLRGGVCGYQRWPGVIVEGTPTAAQGGSTYPADQGRMVFDNSTLMDAETGVLLGPAAKSGGILEASNSTMLNCGTGVNFHPYQNHLPNGNPTRNRSKFYKTTFTVDLNYGTPLDFNCHAQLWGVDGIEFLGCVFQNLRTTETNSSQLGQGIRSLDAHFKVLTLCGDPGPTPPGLCQNVIPSRFTGLDMGIRAANATTSRNFTVDGGLFESNVCGVYATGVTGYEVVNSQFNIGGSMATALTNWPDEEHWDNRHRGVYSYNSSGFAVDDNSLQQQGAHSLTEGIVIGYSEGNNDIVFRNSAEDLESAYIGEGICAEVDIPGQAAQIGLQFLCNENSNNSTNFWSRKVTSAPSIEQNKHTIRLNQGGASRPADNAFDQWPTYSSNWDFKVTTTNSPIGYWHRDAAPYQPVHYTTGLTGLFPHLATTIPTNNCASKSPPVKPPIPPYPGPMAGLMDDERTAYEDVRYLHDQLIDGGQTAAVVLQIELSWPQDAWPLRDYLMAKSPNLSVVALKEMVLRNTLPAVMVTEVLTANPGATRTDGFLTWLQEDSGHPLPEYLLNMVVASWDQRGYRDALVNAMAMHHTNMSQAANWLVQHYRRDTTSTPLDSIAATWRQVGTVAARYAEALTWMEARNWAQAAAVIDGLGTEADKKGFDVLEQQRMLDLIDFLEGVAGQGRDESQLDSTEVGTLQDLMGAAYDRPANWISNLLCFGYGICRAPLTGGDERAQPKRMPLAMATPAPVAALDIFPNPASSWVAFHYDLQAEPQQAELLVRDAAGRTVYRMALPAREHQQLWDTREVASGTYSVVLKNAGRELRTEKLIVQP